MMINEIEPNSLLSLPKWRVGWGRRESASWQRGIMAALFMLACPVMVVLPWIALEHFDSSLATASFELLHHGPVEFLRTHYPPLECDVAFGYLGWVAFQGLLYSILTGNGIRQGQTTPSGQVLEYKLNGFAAWVLSLTLGVGCACFGLFDLTIIARKWGTLVATLNLYGILLAAVFFVKAHLFPSHKGDRRFSGSALYDFYMGIELNPRIFHRHWDIKLFHNGRPGIIGWALMLVSLVVKPGTDGIAN
jgi:7-dehydrocholesterol reductase